ncbi:MAG: polysaccharide pyruvyl transferase family protein [Azoarcus sp.]|jgi:polysaccharide pyruvyl transferase WcaK-like protein|nr:polysaccharide pyruvyl transferase family protein [Azoarcus sp.]
MMGNTTRNEAHDQGRPKPRIGITGSFGRGNYGDELYVKVYQQWLGPWADLFLLSGLPRQNYFIELRNAYVDLMDAIVLGGGDLLCPYRPKIDRDFINPAYLRRPVHVAGIGVERNRPEIDPAVVEKWRKFLVNPNIKSISTRDPDSKAWIEQHIKPAVTVGSHPDLVCALSLPPAKRPEGAPILGLVTRHIKDPKEYVLMAEAAARLGAQGWRIRHIVGGVGEHGRKDFENSQALEVPGKETVFSQNLDDISRALGECSLVLSMKLHTTVVATMYGVPTICVNPVVKARAFMRSFGREELAVASNSPKLLDMIAKGVPEVPMDKVQKLKTDASNALLALSQRIWDDFRNASPERRRLLPASPQGDKVALSA